jgi:hypothetical protein
MTLPSHREFAAALRLHHYLCTHHWTGQAVLGPDPGVRFNYRLGRFIKSYLRRLPWRDHYYYLQSQGYWTLSNWTLLLRTGDERYRLIAERCSTHMLLQQQSDGAWEYPNREWQGRVATVEGTWAALGLLESYRQTRDTRCLEGVLLWHRFLIEEIGFQSRGTQLAVNYFAHHGNEWVPNNSALVLRFLAELASVTDDDTYLQPTTGLLDFLRTAQQPSGEFPYVVARPESDTSRPHFQCYQYNAFQCLDLLRYYEVTSDNAVLPLIARVVAFLRGGLATDGSALFACDNNYRRVVYHTGAVSAALVQAHYLGIADTAALARRAYAALVVQQHADGSFTYSRRDYRLLSDQRRYPRYLSMILYHLLQPITTALPTRKRKEDTHATVR